MSENDWPGRSPNFNARADEEAFARHKEQEKQAVRVLIHVDGCGGVMKGTTCSKCGIAPSMQDTEFWDSIEEHERARAEKKAKKAQAVQHVLCGHPPHEKMETELHNLKKVMADLMEEKGVDQLLKPLKEELLKLMLKTVTETYSGSKYKACRWCGVAGPQFNNPHAADCFAVKYLDQKVIK